MTNIGMVGRKSRKGDMEFITTIADSQGTDITTGTKAEKHLKIFTVGDNRDILLMGTGDGGVIVGTADELRTQKGLDTVEEVSKAVLELTHERYKAITGGQPEILPQKGFGVNFLIAGPGKNDLALGGINTTGLYGNPEHDRYDGRGANPITVPEGEWHGTFDGSAWRHINRYVDGQAESGRPIIIETPADGFVEMHDLSMRGTKDIGVNDKLHYGIIIPGRTVRLVHPDARFGDLASYVEQMEGLTGLDVGEKLMGLKEESDPEKNSAAVDLSNRLRMLTGNFYTSLVSELAESSALKQEYTALSERVLRNKGYKQRFEEIGQRRMDSLERVSQGIDALLSRDPQIMRTYIEAANERRTQYLNELFDEEVNGGNN